jgi:hypothetical protein
VGDSRSEAGAAVYSRKVLSIYDPFVLGFSSRFAWGSRSKYTVEFYNKLVTGRHLDVGVGTGYFLDRCAFPVPEPEVALMDMNANSLGATAERLKRYQPGIYTADVLRPIELDVEPFDSIGMSFLFHCLPGSFPEKGRAVFGNLKPYLAPGGRVFGTTILGQEIRPNLLARVLIGIYNGRGIFSNTADSLAGLKMALAGSFSDFSLAQRGLVAFFTGRG